ncbi:hypothetical protein ANCCEY_14318 [Ancylostoma ceylanicum]|uniref:Major facilitator superfamily (MFS) profile domain-containing protein n=1 Tax=Ancylostoma ceylanicum TaxID=53326 RepID=A0A0D6L5A0_9BILA|nr:hypothetical protein ANCCEY_14318 [Ancylostoma ceylanicum]
MAARLMTGFGAGTLSVLRAYAATASVPRDRLSAVSFGTAGYVLGLSFGPAIQAVFTPIGEVGFKIGPVVLNMYTVPAFFMGMMQGIHSFGGSIAQFVAPILTTYLFQISGYKYVMVTQICTLGLALLLTVVFYKRLVPLKMPVPVKETTNDDGFHKI